MYIRNTSICSKVLYILCNNSTLRSFNLGFSFCTWLDCVLGISFLFTSTSILTAVIKYSVSQYAVRAVVRLFNLQYVLHIPPFDRRSAQQRRSAGKYCRNDEYYTARRWFWPRYAPPSFCLPRSATSFCVVVLLSSSNASRPPPLATRLSQLLMSFMKFF